MARLAENTEKEEKRKAKKLASTKEQQQTSNHHIIEPATDVITPKAGRKASACDIIMWYRKYL